MRFNHLCHVILCSLTATFFGVGMPSLLAQPVVDLGPDVFACDSATLDAGNAGATYVWSTTEITQTITVTSSGIYWVDVTDGGGTTRDSIEVEIIGSPDIPVLNDTSVCGPGIYELSANSSADEVLWFTDSISSIPSYLGSDVMVPFQSTETWWVQANNQTPEDTTGVVDLGNGVLIYLTGNRGVTFDVLSPSVLKSVKVLTNQPGSTRIELQDNLGTILDSTTISISATGDQQTEVPLYFDLAVGSGYKLIGTNTTGGFGVLFGTQPYPFEVPGVISLTGSDFGSTDRFNFFVDWIITEKICSSPRSPITVTVLPSPIIELGFDTAICGGSLVLDASYPGASYLWSTGDTTPTITLTQSDTVSVLASIASCEVSDTVSVTFVQEPNAPVVSDTSVCGPGQYLLTSQVMADEVLWYSSDSARTPLAIGQQVTLGIDSTTTLYAEANNYAQLDSIGLSGPSVADLFYLTGIRGLSLDVENPSILKSVRLFANQPGSMRIQLQTAGGLILDSLTVYNYASGNTDMVVDLFFDLPVGQDLKLVGTDVSGGFGVLFGAIPFPYELPDRLSITGSDLGATDRYSYFFDCAIIQKACVSVREPLQVSVLASPEVELGFDAAICDDSLILDASYPGASYLWSTGETTPTITLTQTDTVSVLASIGSCEVIDSVAIEFVPNPLDPIPNDTTICGNGEIAFTVQNPTVYDALLWYADATVDTFLLEADSLIQNIQDTTTLYVSAVNHSTVIPLGISNFNESLASYQANVRGLLFNVLQPMVLKSVKVYSNQLTTATIALIDQNGQSLDSIDITVPGPLGTQVSLYFDLPPGNNYQLIGKNIEGGGLAFYSNNLNYPYEFGEEIQITGAQNGTTGGYYYFYDWELVRKVCESPRVPVTVTVSLPLNLGPDLYACEEVLLNAGNPTATYLWNTGENTQSIVASESGQYWVEISDGQGCSSTDTISITIPVLDLGDDGTLCGTELISGYDSSSVFLWSTGDTTPNLQLFNPGTYWVEVVEPLGCTLTDTITVVGFADFPQVELGPDFVACDSAILDADNSGLSFLWNTGDTSQTITITSSGQYEVAVTNEFECTTTDEINVFIASSPRAEFAYSVNGLTVFFENLSSLGSNFWDLGDGTNSTLNSPIHTYSDTGTYLVQLILVDILNDCGADTFSLEINLSTVGIAPLLASGKISVSPNPAHNHISIGFDQAEKGEAIIALYNLQGQRVFQQKVQILTASQEVPISLPSVPKGIYRLHVLLNHQRHSQPLLLH